MSLAVGNDARTPLTSVAAGPGGSDLVPADPYSGYLDRFRAAFAAETAAFLDLVGGRRANPCPPVNAIEALRIACAAEASAARRLPIRPKDVS
jgi:myo-inositol 2-dehydrogenase/D-chiro-inositol 1-dehydrogenase